MAWILICKRFKLGEKICYNSREFFLGDYFFWRALYVSNALWDKDESFKIWGQKVRGRGHGGIKYAETALTGLVNTMSWKALVGFYQTYTSDVFWDRDEGIKFWGKKVTVQGHSGITYAETIIAHSEAYSTWCLMSS